MNDNVSFLHRYSYFTNDDRICITRRSAVIPTPVSEQACTDTDVTNLTELVNTACYTIVHWRKNLFEVPSCSAGRRFVKVLSTWLQHFNTQSKYRSIAIKKFKSLSFSRLFSYKNHRRISSDLLIFLTSRKTPV